MFLKYNIPILYKYLICSYMAILYFTYIIINYFGRVIPFEENVL